MTNPPQSPRSPKKPRRIQPKIVGHTSPSPRASVARGSLQTLAGVQHASATRPSARPPAVRPPVGAPGMRGFPRARPAAAPHPGNSVARALREQAAAEPTVTTPITAAPTPELLDAPKSRPRKPSARALRNAPARPSVTGRPTTPDEAPMDHAPATGRPATPPLRTTQARTTVESTHRAAQARHRLELWQRDEPSRPRPSRVLAEMHAAIADDAATAE